MKGQGHVLVLVCGGESTSSSYIFFTSLFLCIQIFLDNLRSSLCCLSVVTAAWLCNYVAVSDGEMRQKALQILQQMQSLPSSVSSSSAESSLLYYTERSVVVFVVGVCLFVCLYFHMLSQKYCCS